MKTFLIFVKVFLIGALLIISNENLAFSVPENRDRFFVEYTDWLGHLFDHGIVVVGYVVGNEWLPPLPGNSSG
jgi:hypothetical protein